MIDHSDSTNGKSSPKYFQDRLKADPDGCKKCQEVQKISDETWEALEEMKAGYEKAIKLSGLNVLELERELSDLRLENRKLREELVKFRAN